jgi:hypothetical protein
MKRKRPSHRLSGEKRKKSATGIDEGMDRFFVGGEWQIAGFMHIKPPRWTREYEKLRVRDLVRRIQDDIEELLARAYSTYTEEWQQKFAPNYWRQFPITYEGHLRCVINQSIAEELCRGLWERIISQDKKVSCKACEEYQRLLGQFLESEPRYAANALAFLAQKATAYLAHLFVKRPALTKEIAKTLNLWPVNLGLRVKVVKGKPVREITRLAFARNYLTELELNSQCDFPSAQGSGTGADSPFRLAAEELYTKMLMLKDDPQRHVWFPKLTPWAKRLFALTVPMTKRNSAEWWNVAKIYLYERWDKAQKEFKPLIKHLGFKYPIQLSSKVPYESMVKSRVIDNDLKDAFLGLARPDL